MEIVERPWLAPGHCIASLKSEDDKGFIDTQLTPAVVDPRIYLSVSFVEECARNLGMVDGSTFADLAERERALMDEVQTLEERVAELEQKFAAIDLLESQGFTARKKLGRPKAAA